MNELCVKGPIPTLMLALFALSCAPTQPGARDYPVVVAEEQPVQWTDTITIRFGSSHGMCVGYCRQEFELHPTTLVGQRYTGGRGADPVKYPMQRQVANLNAGQYEQVVMALHSNALWSGPDTVGCPDCADGGACWMELAKGGRQRRITFDCSGGAGVHDHLANLLWDLTAFLQWKDPSTEPASE